MLSKKRGKPPPHLLQDATSEKCNNRNDGNDAHIANPLLDGVFNDPETDCGHAYERYPPLLYSKAFACWANVLYLEIAISRG